MKSVSLDDLDKAIPGTIREIAPPAAPVPSGAPHHSAVSLVAKQSGEPVQLPYPFHGKFRNLLLAALYIAGPQSDLEVALTVPGSDKPLATLRLSCTAIDWKDFEHVADSEGQVPITRDASCRLVPPSRYGW